MRQTSKQTSYVRETKHGLFGPAYIKFNSHESNYEIMLSYVCILEFELLIKQKYVSPPLSPSLSLVCFLLHAGFRWTATYTSKQPLGHNYKCEFSCAWMCIQSSRSFAYKKPRYNSANVPKSGNCTPNKRWWQTKQQQKHQKCGRRKNA